MSPEVSYEGMDALLRDLLGRGFTRYEIFKAGGPSEPTISRIVNGNHANRPDRHTAAMIRCAHKRLTTGGAE